MRILVLTVWNVANGSLEHTLRGHSAAIFSAVFSSDGRRAVTASQDGKAIIWDTATGLPLHTLTSDSDPVTSVIVFPGTPDSDRQP